MLAGTTSTQKPEHLCISCWYLVKQQAALSYDRYRLRYKEKNKILSLPF